MEFYLSNILLPGPHLIHLKSQWASINIYFLGDCTGTVKMQFGKKEDLVHIKKFQVKIKVGHGRIRLYNLFNGDKALGKLIVNEPFE